MLGEQGGRRRGYKGTWGIFGPAGRCHPLDCGDGFIEVHIRQNLSNYTLSIFSLLYIDCTFIKLLKK